MGASAPARAAPRPGATGRSPEPVTRVPASTGRPPTFSGARARRAKVADYRRRELASVWRWHARALSAPWGISGAPAASRVSLVQPGRTLEAGTLVSPCPGTVTPGTYSSPVVRPLF
jgi:hypothetical protein